MSSRGRCRGHPALQSRRAWVQVGMFHKLRTYPNLAGLDRLDERDRRGPFGSVMRREHKLGAADEVGLGTDQEMLRAESGVAAEQGFLLVDLQQRDQAARVVLGCAILDGGAVLVFAQIRDRSLFF